MPRSCCSKGSRSRGALSEGSCDPNPLPGSAPCCRAPNPAQLLCPHTLLPAPPVPRSPFWFSASPWVWLTSSQLGSWLKG